MILTDEDVKALKLEVYGPHKCAVEVDALRTVLVKMTEIAVLEKLKQQEPVGHWFSDDPAVCAYPGSGYSPGAVPPQDALHIVPLYAAPVPAAVPDGWKLVPVDPTIRMLSNAYHSQGEATITACETIYRAMLSTAPVPATTPKE